ncbi:zinc finger CCCH domain-containing protein 13 isoform X9 [Drosophila guanche]|uniref:zinc finger CCCH domain-containing protein 13 isoform X9 n=1 Tax=Drosophila guanche TaxID=7266 RepID=UPI001470B149|nr:zinc finger CCCH domain-containing protein 13 isoform X9 [Drosophila guanche]
MEQFEQLLTCCVCLDRYRIPKLLPCQHSFCMEPCMEGLVDYVRRQVKCPECRAEHRIPYNGVQAFPTNVTLQRFLELHIEITGELPDPTSGQIMERCGVCSEKAYLSHCAHCEKKICEDCKSAHMDILRREITRFNSQIRRSLHRLQDSLAIIEKNTMSLQTNAISVTEEIDEIYQRITKAIKDRSDQLKGEIDRYLAVELRNLTTLKENLDLEITNIGSNCDIVDKYMNETVEWDDCELMDTKEIFLKTVEFLRHFEYENNDYSRRVRFLVSIDPNQLVMNLATFGDLNIAPHSTPGGSVSSSHLAPPSGLQPGLMRSKSDHRLATQFRQQEERGGYNDEPVLGGRKFGERPQRSATTANSDRYGEGSRYGRSDYDYENDYENESTGGRTGKSSRFRSRFVRSHQNDDSDTEQQQQQRQQELKERKERVLDSEDVSRGQLSGIIRLSDCSRVVQRLADIGKEKKSDKKSDAACAAQAAVQAAIQNQKAAMQRQQQKQSAAAADEDELARQKRKSVTAGAAGAATSSSEAVPEQRPTSERLASLKTTRGGEDSDGSGSNQAAASSPVRTATAATRAETASATDSDANPTPPTTQQSKPPVSAQVAAVKKTQRSGSSDSSASTESSASSGAAAAAAAVAAAATPSSSQHKAPSTARHSSARDSVASSAVPEKKPFVSRFLPQHSNPPSASNGTSDKKKAESSSSSEEETSSESESESEPETKPKASTSSTATASKSTPSSASSSTTAATSAGSSSTSGSSYRDRLEARRASRDDTALASRSSYATPSSSGYGSAGSSSTARTRTVPAPHHASESEDRYGSSSTGTGTGSSALPFSIPYISRPNRARYRKRLADV